MTTDAELVALLLTEARLRRALRPIDNQAELKAAGAAWKAADKALRAAVLGRLEAEAARPERPKVRDANAPLLAATHALDDCPCPTCRRLDAEGGVPR